MNDIRQMPRESREDWKIYKNVFDAFTIRHLYKLITQGIFEGLEGPVMIGKEANVFSAIRKDGTKVIVKIYRLHSCNFNKMYDYIRADPRFANLKKKRREVIFAWVQREHRNLVKARAAGVRVPTVLASLQNIIVLEFIGDETVSSQAKDDLPEDIKGFADEVVESMKKLYKGGLVHGDLSEFNILVYRKSPVLIDFSQGTTVESPQARELLTRDVKNIVRFFRKYGLKLDESAIEKKITGRKPIQL
jgi:RIO kinase 1